MCQSVRVGVCLVLLALAELRSRFMMMMLSIVSAVQDLQNFCIEIPRVYVICLMAIEAKDAVQSEETVGLNDCH